ncbi:MAG: thioredoxin domain-containing protein [Nitrospirae bacterium]|nr:thioredoxin domain-containing protein [Nitrospirota bacterium]
MKKFITTLSLVLTAFIIISGCAKEAPKEVKIDCADKESVNEIKTAQTGLQNSLVDLKNVQTEIQNSQKEILAKISDLEKKMTTIQAQAAPVRPTVDFDKVYELPIGSSPVRGNKNAKVTIVEFSDFQCPYCAQLEATLSEVSKAYPKDVKLVYKQYPLPFHQNAMPAAKASLAAGEQGKFWEMHDLIFQNFSKLNDGIYKEFAQQLGLNVEKFAADFAGNKYDQQIQQDMALARTAGVSGTPTLFINGKRMQQRSLNDFKQTIDAILKK